MGKITASETERLIEEVLNSKDWEEIEKKLKTFSPETVAFLFTFVQVERASVIYLPILAASTPLEIYAKNLSALKTDERFYKAAAVSFDLERERLSRLKGRGQKLLKDFVESQEKHSDVLRQIKQTIRAFREKVFR